MQHIPETQKAVSGKSDKEAWLLGQPSLRKYLDFVESTVIDGKSLRRDTLADEWRVANDYYYELEKTEAGLADKTEILALDIALEPLADIVRADPRFRRTFDLLPTRIAMVGLDHLIVSQASITLNHSDRLVAQMGPQPKTEDIFRFCLPLEREEAEVNVRNIDSKRYMFWSESSDLRFLEPVLLTAGQIPGYQSFGPLGGALGLMVGFGSNFLNVVESDSRLLIHNGHHRAHAMRAMGFSHAPCIIQTVTRRDELDLVVSHDVAKHPEFYFSAARPPLLKDFFDPNICKVLDIHKVQRVIEVSFDVRDFEVRDFGTAR